jgi:DNA-binding NtrC family response regulator
VSEIVLQNLPRICLIEDDPLVLKALHQPLKDRARVWTFESAEDLLKNFRDLKGQFFDLILMDLRHPGDLSGEKSIALIPEMIQKWPEAMIVVASGVEDLSLMRTCVARGADRFVSKDGLLRELNQIVLSAEAWKERRRALDLKILGETFVIRSLKRDLFRVQSSPGDVLLEGETGSGKELCAEALHDRGPFVGVNVATIPKDLFESTMFGHEKGAFSGALAQKGGYLLAAEGGTLFLDEFQNLTLDHQGKLLRVLETREFIPVGAQRPRPFQARLVFATNQRLLELVERGEFREDLYYRISQITLRIPPLRLRRADIPTLIEKFLESENASGRFRFSSEALDFLVQEYDWPGNVRELKGLIRSLVSTSRIPIWGREEILATLRLETEPQMIWKSKESPLMSDGFDIQWDQGLDSNLDRLSGAMIEKLMALHEPSKVQSILRLKRSRFYELLKKLR